MARINRNQKIFLFADYLFDINPFEKYQILFDHLDTSALNEHHQGPGQHHVPKPALLRALIYKSLKPLPPLSDLVLELGDNPSITLKCGLNSCRIPPVERFSSFLRDTNNYILQTISNSLVKELILLGEISGISLSIDPYPIPANVKENNLKTNVKDRFYKYCIPKGGPDYLLGPTVQFLPAEKKISFFWGYRDHTITDMPSELPVIETTKPANVADIKLFIPLFRQLRDTYNLNPQIILGDSIYDSEYILSIVIDELNALPCIARNYRWKKHRPLRLSPRSKPLYLTGFNSRFASIRKKTV